MFAVYKIVNVKNGHFYVGSSIVPRTRFRTHRRELRTEIHHCKPLQRAWKKYGEASFRFDIIEEMDCAESLAALEGEWLNEHYGKSYCYNTGTSPGAAFLGRNHTDEAKRKVAVAQNGKKHRLGHTNSAEHRARQSAGMRGIKKSPEHCEKIRQRMIGTSYAKGRIMPEEQKAAMGKTVKELTSGLEFPTVAEAARHFAMERPNLIRTLRNGGLLKRGPNAGLHFQYSKNML